MPLCRLIFFSRARDPAVAQTVLQELAFQARLNNVRSAMSGRLTIVGEWFIECLEGRRAVLSEAWSRIQRDERHTQITLVTFHEIDERMFADWLLCDLPPAAQRAVIDRFAVNHNFDPHPLSARSFSLLFERLSALEQGRPVQPLEIEFAVEEAGEGWQSPA